MAGTEMADPEDICSELAWSRESSGPKVKHFGSLLRSSSTSFEHDNYKSLYLSLKYVEFDQRFKLLHLITSWHRRKPHFHFPQLLRYGQYVWEPLPYRQVEEQLSLHTL